jgi:LytS/YehU family sensor histidine kinase
MNYISIHQTTIIGIGIGAVAGFAYYYFVGCASGACAITSSPINITVYGAIMGGLLFSMFKKEKK